jgi:hypothetical protein
LALTAAAGIGFLPIGCRPDRLLDGFYGELLSDASEIVITGRTEENAPFLVALLGVRASASQGLWNGGVGKPFPVIAEFDQQARGRQVSGSRQGLKDEMVWVLAEQLFHLTDKLEAMLDQG